jgi:uncharacterized membrane protein
MEQSPETRPPVGQTDRVTQTPMGVERRERSVIDQAGGEHAETSTRDHGAEQSLQLYKGIQLIWLLLGIVEVLIGLRVVLKLFAANANNGFASFIYGAAGVFVAPFVGLTGTPAAGGSVLEISSLIAMAIYALVAWGIVWVVRLLFLRSSSGSSTTYDRYQS